IVPFDATVTIPRQAGASSLSSGETQPLGVQSLMLENVRYTQSMMAPGMKEAAHKFVEQYRQNPFLNRAELGIGSNWWLVAGSKTDTGNAMLANDPHLALGIPSTFYEMHVMVDSQTSPMNVSGVSFSGIPGVFLGQNDRISWGATTCSLDTVDFFTERVVIENGVPVATRYKGTAEPLVIIPEVFKINQVQNGVGDDVIVVTPGNRASGLNVPPANFIVPRRNNGPLIPGGPADAISIQFTGASPTRDIEGIFSLARARNLDDFKRGIRLLDGATLNWAYADVGGNIATFVGGRVPLREDLQAGIVDGLPPFLLRDGTGAVRNEWVPKNGTGPGFDYEFLPFEEMPQTVNPVQGFLVNANNDPIGLTLDNNPINQMRREGIYYISSGFNPGFRATKITNLLKEELQNNHGNGKVSFREMQRIQSNVQMFDAEVLTPHIIRAFQAARSAGAPAELAALANDLAVREAVDRLSNWDFSTPTGIAKGYDAGDIFGIRLPPSTNEVSSSIATTIYTVWRSQILANTIIATLQRVGLGDRQPFSDRILVDLRFLLDRFSANQGVGASGLDFFDIPGVNAPANIRRNGIILKSLRDALNLLKGNDFAAAFGGSTNQNDYRWGKLHRITFSHPFGGLAPQFSIPTAGNFTDLSPTLPGLATDGSFETIDIGSFNVLSASSGGYTFNGGPARRYVGELRRDGIKAVQIIPGGESGVVGNRFYANQLPLWLTNEYHDIFFTRDEINDNCYSKIIYKPTN
ncbi:MAG TPA: penicillin acylase family protein, partial [Pyrinomonadaceae bacterium]|nr:penicillin acylase family protein [Pyrinomonadaceae bacterium]